MMKECCEERKKIIIIGSDLQQEFIRCRYLFIVHSLRSDGWRQHGSRKKIDNEYSGLILSIIYHSYPALLVLSVCT